MKKYLLCMTAVLSGASAVFGQQGRIVENLKFSCQNGAHVWEYWRTGLPEGLKFISKTLHR